MAMNKNQRLIIEALASNKTKKAREVAIMCLEQDTTSSNRRLREECLPAAMRIVA